MCRRSCLRLLVLASCLCSDSWLAADEGQQGQSSTDIRLWHGLGGGLGQAIQEQADQFNQLHPETRVEITIHSGYPGTMQALRAAIKAGDAPEIAVVEAHSVLGLAASGQVASTSNLIDGDKRFALDNVLPGTLTNLRWKNQLYGMPFVRSTPVLYYNKNRFQDAGLDPNKPPKNWTEFREAARRLTTDPERAYAFAIKPNPWHFEALVFSAGGQLTNPEATRSEFVEPATGPLQLWADMIHKDKTARLGDRDAFLSGQAAMLLESTALVASFEKAAVNFEIGTAFFPGSEGHKPGVVAGGGIAVIPAKTSPQKQRAAFQFLTFFIATEPTAELSRRTGYVPVRKSAIQLLTREGFYKERPNYLAGVEQMEFAREIPPAANWPQAMAVLGKAMGRCLEENEPAAMSLAQAAMEVDRILKQGPVRP